MKKATNNYNVNNKNYGWIFLLIFLILFIIAVIGGYTLYQHAVSPDNNYSFSEHTDLRDISDTATANNLYNTITSNSVYYNMFYKETLNNTDYLTYGFTRSKIEVPTLFGEKFTVLKNKIDNTINNLFYNENETSLHTDSSYSNYQFTCTYISKDALYNCTTALQDMSKVTVLYSKLTKVEQESEYFYVYDKAVFVKTSPSESFFYTDINLKNKIVLCDNSLVNAGSVCTGFITDADELSDYIFDQYTQDINTYKHTFIKKNGVYYYVSTEIEKEEA